MRSALVLNATFEPLSIVPARRAICLVLSDKAEIIEEDGTQIRAETFVMPGPLVIRLREQKIHNTLWLHNMKNLFHCLPPIV